MSQFKVGDRVRVRPDAFLTHDSTFFQMSKPYQVKIHTIVRFGDNKTLMFDHTGWAFEPEIFERVPIETMKTKEELTAELAGVKTQLAQIEKDVAAIPCAAPEEERWKPNISEMYWFVSDGRNGRYSDTAFYGQSLLVDNARYNAFGIFHTQAEAEREAEITRVSRKARYWRDKFGGYVFDGQGTEIVLAVRRNINTGEFESFTQIIQGVNDLVFRDRKNCEKFISAMGNDLNILYPPKQ